jgi:hypothetical protein
MWRLRQQGLLLALSLAGLLDGVAAADLVPGFRGLLAGSALAGLSDLNKAASVTWPWGDVGDRGVLPWHQEGQA